VQKITYFLHMGPSQQLKICLAARLGPLAVGSVVASEFASRLRLLHKLLFSFFFFSPTAIPLPLALQRRLDKKKVATAADKRTSGVMSAGASASTSATNSSINGEESESSDDEKIDMNLSISLGVAFDMVVGTGAREVYQ
jgi:hypothetical protein